MLSQAALQAAETPPGACATLASLIDHAPAGRAIFLVSYPTVTDGPLKDSAFLYDNAVAAVALVGCGEPERAARIGRAMVTALDHDRFWHDGRLRNAYAAGPVGDNATVKLAGWWDVPQARWLEDRYQVGSDNGNMAWTVLALLSLETATKEKIFGDAAQRIGVWISGAQDARGPGGFTGGTFGHEPDPQLLRWKSTEHNTDIAAAFARLAERPGAVTPAPADWRGLAASAGNFVAAMWNEDCHCFATGTGDDGITHNPTMALDAQIWPLTALPGAAQRWAAAWDAVERRFSVSGGVAYGEAHDALWTEGTGQMALLAFLLGKQDRAATLNAAIAAQRAPQGGYFATSGSNLPTGFLLETDPGKPRLYFHLPHLGATAWAALAESHFNPFTGTKALP